jgi:hypothetical protein
MDGHNGHCVPDCVPPHGLFEAIERHDKFWPKEEPADLAGLSVKSLVALTGIEPVF